MSETHDDNLNIKPPERQDSTISPTLPPYHKDDLWNVKRCDIQPGERNKWHVDGYEINDGRSSIVRAPNPDEFPELTPQQRQLVAKASRENLATIVRDRETARLVARLVATLADLLAEAEISHLEVMHRRGFQGCARDAYNLRLMPTPFNQAKDLITAIRKAGGNDL